MSERCWVNALLGGLFVLNLSYIYGLFHDCSVCCVIQDKIGDLNCSWRSDVSTQYSVSLQSLTYSDEPPILFNITLGQNWVLIRRKDLVTYHEYNLIVTGGGKEATQNFTYSKDGHNIFIRPPQLYSTISENNKSLEITWKDPEDESENLPVQLRYRILGAHNWSEVNKSDLEINTYALDDPEPYTDYEFQIRYLPDETNKKGSLWSESHVLTSPEMVPNGSPDGLRSWQNGSSLLVMWKPLDHHSARGKILNYVVTYAHGGKKMTAEVPCCSKILPAQSRQLCVRARNSKGLGPPLCVAPLCTEIANKAKDLDCKVWGDSSGRINVLCKELLKFENVLSSVMEWRALGEDKTEVNWTRGQTVNETLVFPGEFTPGVPYYISVYVFYNTDLSCIRTFSTETYSQEEVPTAAPNFTSHILSAGNVLVSWEEIPMQHRRGLISHHTIYVKNTDHSEFHTVSNGRGNKTLSGLSSGTVYTIWMTASTRAGEGKPSPQKTFQTSGNRHRVLLIVAVVASILFVCGAVLCFRDRGTSFWPKIPKPEGKFKEFFMASSANMWQPQQVSLNPLIAVVEEIEPPPQPPTPPPELQPPPPPQPSPPLPVLNTAPVITSGYERHFMPTPEEVMGLG